MSYFWIAYMTVCVYSMYTKIKPSMKYAYFDFIVECAISWKQFVTSVGG